MLVALKRARPVSQYVKMFQMSKIKKYYPEYGLVIHPVKVATRKPGRNPTKPTLYPTLPYLSIFSKGLYSLLNFLSPFTGWVTNPVLSTISYRLLSHFRGDSFFSGCVDDVSSCDWSE